MLDTDRTADEVLHAAEVENLERRIMELALEETEAANGAIFLWDDKKEGLVVDFHMVGGVLIGLESTVLQRRHNRPNGIAMHIFDVDAPYLCPDTSRDPHYAPYFLDVKAIAGVPIRYQGRPIGVISVSAAEVGAFDGSHLDALTALADSSAKFLRRAQLSRHRWPDQKRPFVIKGLSPEWLEVERQLEQVAPTDASVLIRGESGTGKELIAHAIHFNSQRADRPFISVNCAAIPENLLESTLFGHAKGAFTGASYTKVGDFTKAEGGTLFLDEVGDMPPTLQAKLLRAAESGEIQPVGSNDPPHRADVRLICATHKDLAAMVREGRFRDDLYYRLGVITLEVPPLRSYKHNLEVLVQGFMMHAARALGKPVTQISPAALALFVAYDYPGNMRELRNAVEHAVIMTRNDTVQPSDLPRSLREPVGESEPIPDDEQLGTLPAMRERWLQPLEQRYLEGVLRATGGNVRKAAQMAGVNRVTLYRLLKKRGVSLRRFGQD